ncbi:MAG: hypothetical protein Q9170_006933 [Blastenia crenularia]
MSHSPDTLNESPPEVRLSPVDPAPLLSRMEKMPGANEVQRQRTREAIPPVYRMVLLQDFEFWAHTVLSEVAWAYYRSAADQERSYDGSMEASRRYFFRLRMLRDMSNGSTKTSFLGITSELPIYIAPGAMAKLGHPLGEVNLTKAAERHGIVQSISANSSCSLEDIFDAKKESQALLYQRHTKLPIVVKGVQSIEDVELCVKQGAQGVMISNHGGRQVDYAPAPIDIPYELRTYRPDLFDKIDVMIDGGVRSGADVVKLLALGAKAVGFGRTFLYANATHGEDGVKRVIEILREEIVNTMRNVGASTISDLKPEMVGPSGPWVGANRPLYATMD